jgi:hypothetical protein
VVGDGEVGSAGGAARRLEEFHVSFRRSQAGLAPVAGDAGADDIFPGMRTAAEAWNNVVKGEVAALFTAVLAGIEIPVKDLVAGHFALAVGPAYHPGEPDYGGEGKGPANGVDIAAAVFQHLRLALVDKDDGAAGAADGERLVALVEDQYRIVDHFRRSPRSLTAPILLQRKNRCKAKEKTRKHINQERRAVSLRNCNW